MNAVGILCVVGFDKTKDLSCVLVYPVSEVAHAVLCLGLEILHMGSGYFSNGYAALDVVNVHKQLHVLLLGWFGVDRPTCGSEIGHHLVAESP